MIIINILLESSTTLKNRMALPVALLVVEAIARPDFEDGLRIDSIPPWDVIWS